MIKTKPVLLDEDYTYTYSDAGMMIERDGILYADALDPTRLHRVYEETDIPVEETEPEESEGPHE